MRRFCACSITDKKFSTSLRLFVNGGVFAFKVGGCTKEDEGVNINGDCAFPDVII
jgi:hypothetical protein